MNEPSQTEPGEGEDGAKVSALRAARHRARRRAAEVATHLGVTTDTLFGWERGERPIRLDAAVKMLRLYQETVPDLTLDDLVEAEPTPEPAA